MPVIQALGIIGMHYHDWISVSFLKGKNLMPKRLASKESMKVNKTFGTTTYNK